MTEDNTELERVHPREAVELYMETRKDELSKTTHVTHGYRLQPFIEWCEEVRDVKAMSELNGRHLHEYRLWRREDGDLKPISLSTQLSTLRVFLKFCDDLECVREGLWDKIQMPTITMSDNQRDEILESDEAKRILDYLERYEYSSLKHALLLLLWHTGIRSGAAHSLDVDDFSPKNGWIQLRHCPDEGTTLKNGERGERYVALSSEAVTVLNDYIEHNRHDVTDDYGREPLFTSSHGRYTKGSMRRIVYLLTQPCYTGEECPHDKEKETCEHREFAMTNLCPSSIAPHDVRRGAITHFLLNDVPQETVSGRMNVSADTLEQHYDKRSAEALVEQRRRFLDNV